MTEEKRVGRRSYLKYAGTIIAAVAVAAAAGYYARPPEKVVEEVEVEKLVTETVEKPIEVEVEKLVTETVEKTVEKVVEKKGPIICRYITTETLPSSVKIINEYIIPEFRKIYPEITVNAEYIDWGALSDKFAAAVAAGALPECAQIDGYQVTLYSQADVLEPVTDVIKEIDPTGEDYLDAALLPVKFGEDWLAVPFSLNITLWWYREDWLAETGLKPPKSWDDILRIAEATTKERTIGGEKVMTYGVSIPGKRGSYGDQFTYMMMRTNSTDMVDEDDRVIIDQPPNIDRAAETLEFLTELAKFAPPGFLDYSWSEGRFALYGNIAGMLSSAARVLQLAYAKAPDVYPQLKAVHVPPGPKYDGKEEYSWCAEDAQVVFKESTYPDAGKKFVGFLTTGDREIKLLATVPLHLAPTRKSTYENPEYLESNPLIKENAYLLDVIKSAASRLGGEISTRYDGRLKSLTLGKAYEKRLFIESFHRVWIDKMDPTEAVKILAEEMRKGVPEKPIKPFG